MSETKTIPKDNDPTTAALFAVELREVYVPMPSEVKVQPQFHAVVDVERSHVFAVVGDDYKLVTNEEAITLGRECFKTIFKLTDVDKMRGFNAILPKTRSFCHLDFLHADRQFVPLKERDNDMWQPYLRVTNSYNRMFALNFELGFCRWICKNGMIFGKKNIEFKFTHSKKGADPKIAFTLRAGDFATMEAQFRAHLENLQRYHVPRRVMWPLICKAFGFSVPKDLSRAEENEEGAYMQRKVAINRLTKKYFDEMGENGYAAVNVLTDYASRPDAEKFAEGRINRLQHACGDWMAEFVVQIAKREFRYEDYLGDYFALAT
jgi:hypothetical protein